MTEPIAEGSYEWYRREVERLRAEVADADEAIVAYARETEQAENANARVRNDVAAVRAILWPDQAAPIVGVPQEGDIAPAVAWLTAEQQRLSDVNQALLGRLLAIETALTRCQDVKRIVAAERDALHETLLESDPGALTLAQRDVEAINAAYADRDRLKAERDAAHALLRDAATALDDLGACDVADCDKPGCLRVLQRILAALDTPTALDRRRLLEDLTAEAIDAGSYAEPAPEMRPGAPESQETNDDA